MEEDTVWHVQTLFWNSTPGGSTAWKKFFPPFLQTIEIGHFGVGGGV